MAKADGDTDWLPQANVRTGLRPYVWLPALMLAVGLILYAAG